MGFSIQIPKASASGNGGGGGTESTGNGTGALVDPYSIPASFFPEPANVSSPLGVAVVAIAPLPTSPFGYAVVNASVLSDSPQPNASVWFETASYSATDAAVIAANGSCGQGCGDLPLNWSAPERVADYSTPVTDVVIGALGTMLVIGASSGGKTYLYTWSEGADGWNDFYTPIAGRLGSIATDPTEVAVATISADSVLVTTLSADGDLEAEATLTPAGLGSTGILSTALTLAPAGAAYSDDVLLSINSTSDIQLATSLNGTAFSALTTIGNFTPLPPSYGVGAPAPQSGGEPSAGQLALVSVGGELTLLYTTYLGGEVTPALLSSGNGGVQWDGPYLVGAANGSVQNPTLTVGPAGLVYGAWAVPDAGPGTIEEATFEPDGLPMTQPEAIFPMSSPAPDFVPAPAIAVDGFERPLVVWPSELPNGSGELGYTGGYLGANVSLNLTENLLNQSLGPWDFSSAPASPSYISSFLSGFSEQVSSAVADLDAGSLCAAQTVTGGALYQDLLRVPLTTTGSDGASCNNPTNPDPSSSPLLGATGVDVPNTYAGVYLDWALQAEGVPVATSPLTPLTSVPPYGAMALAATLPPPETNSTSVDSSTEQVTVTPTPYSPTAFDLAVSASLPVWTQTVSSTRCERSGGGWGVYLADDVTSINQTWTNVTLEGGAPQSFPGTVSYPSVWIDNLSADQTYGWSASFRGLTSEVYKTDNSCTGQTTSRAVSPVTLGPTSISSVSLRGSFETSLSITPGTPFVSAAYNSEHTAANLTVQFNTTLPTTVVGSLSNGTGTQRWNTTTPAISGGFALPKVSGVGQVYTVSVSATSRSGTASAPDGPSLSYGAPGGSPPEQTSASCSFTLATAVPTVTISNATGAPYTSVNASTLNVTWNSTVNATGFFTYFEIGTPLNWTISGITPVRAPDGHWVYSLEVHGLEPMVAYNATLGVSVSQNCLMIQDQIVGQSFKTGSGGGSQAVALTHGALSHVWVNSLPYDPFNGTGGGIEVGWDNPAPPKHSVGALTLLGGDVTVSNASGSLPPIPFNSTAPIIDGSAPERNGTPGAYELNLPGLGSLTPNSHYTVEVVANYSYLKLAKGGSLVPTNETAHGSKSAVTYEQDSTDGGLSDSTKANGWWAIENGSPTHVYPIEDRDSTNGLVSDYVEMEYSLDPNTLDTSHSHMLDTWNLTFLLGPAGATSTTSLLGNISTYFEFYNEEGSYSFPQANKVNQTNLVCSAIKLGCHREGWTGDSSAAASTVLWSSTELWTASTHKSKGVPGPFLGVVNSPNESLRATLGTYGGTGPLGGDLVMTVWGKLSWGADPWETSTSNDGRADGEQLDPRGPVILQLVLNSWEMGYGSEPLAPDPGVVARVDVTQPGPNGTTESDFSGYTSEIIGGEGNGINCQGHNSQCSLLWTASQQEEYNGTPFIVSIPISSESTTANWSITMVDNDISSAGPLEELATASGSLNLLETDQSVGVNPTLSTPSPPAVTMGNASFTYTILAPTTKAPTFLVAPTNESTLDWIAPHHARYIGEPDFDLLVVNVTNDTRVNLTGVAALRGSPSGSLTFEPGLNTILVPRAVFATSPLAGSLLSGNTINLSSSSGLNFSARYWSNRTTANGPPGAELIRLFNAANYSEQNNSTYNSTEAAFGGDPHLQALERRAGSNEALALSAQNGTNASWFRNETADAENLTGEEGNESQQDQLVVWINITNSSSFTNLTAEVESLLAGLVLNSSGAVNYCVVNVTSTLPSLGLSQTVLSAVGAPGLTSIGDEGQPPYTNWSAVGELTIDSIGSNPVLSWLDPFWNDLTVRAPAFLESLGISLVLTLEGLPGEFVSAVLSATEYIDGALEGILTVVTDGLELLASATAGALKDVAGALLWGVESLVDSAFSAVVNSIDKAMTSYVSGLWGDWQVLSSEYNNSSTVTKSSATAFLNRTFSGPFLVAVGVMIAIAVALTILQVLSVGVDFLVDDLVVLIAGSVASAVVGYAFSLPSDLLSPQTVEDAAAAFNNSSSGASGGSGGGQHPASSDLLPFLTVLIAVMGIGMSGYQLWGDIPKAVQMAKFGMSDSIQVDYVLLEPIVSAALGVLSITLATLGVTLTTLGLAPKSETVFLDLIGFFLGWGSAFFTIATLKDSSSRIEIEDTEGLNEAYAGLLLDFAGGVDGTAQLAADLA